MPTPQTPEEQAASLAELAASRLGRPMDKPAAPAAAAPVQPAVPQPPKETAHEQAEAAGAPNTEADEMGQDPALYKVKFGDDDVRALSENQIAATFSRYADLNHRMSRTKPFVDLAERLLERAPPGTDPQQLVQTIVKAIMHNPQMGQAQPQAPGPQGGPQQSNADISAQLEQWEKDNSASLPPGYKDLLTMGQSLPRMMQQLMGMMQGAQGRAAGVADVARATAKDSRDQMISAQQQTIANNLNTAQRQLGLPDEAAQDFLAFASERGYVKEDLLDPQFVLKIMEDFRNRMNQPEMERIRQQAQRRQAFIGSTGGAPAAGGAPGGSAPQGPSPLDALVDHGFARRFPGA